MQVDTEKEEVALEIRLVSSQDDLSRKPYSGTHLSSLLGPYSPKGVTSRVALVFTSSLILYDVFLK